MKDKFKKDLINKLKELRKEGYIICKDNDRIVCHKRTNIPVGTSSYLEDLLKEWYLDKFKEYFSEIIEQTADSFLTFK